MDEAAPSTNSFPVGPSLVTLRRVTHLKLWQVALANERFKKSLIIVALTQKKTRLGKLECH